MCNMYIYHRYTNECIYMQKQPPRCVPRKRCSENIKQIYRRAPMPKCDFNKSCFATLLKPHFGMSVLLYICCIFSERLFLKTPLGGCLCTCKDIL